MDGSHAATHPGLSDDDRAPIHLCENAKFTAECTDVRGDCRKLRLGDVAAFDAADAGLGDAHGAGDVLLGQAAGLADLGETVGDELAVAPSPSSE